MGKKLGCKINAFVEGFFCSDLDSGKKSCLCISVSSVFSVSSVSSMFSVYKIAPVNAITPLTATLPKADCQIAFVCLVKSDRHCLQYVWSAGAVPDWLGTIAV